MVAIAIGHCHWSPHCHRSDPSCYKPLVTILGLQQVVSCAVFHCNPSVSAHTVPVTRVVSPVFVSAMQITPEA